MNEENIFTSDEISELLSEKKYVELKRILSDMNEADIASLFEDLSVNELVVVYRLLPKDLAADTFVEMEPDNQEILIHSFSDSELREIMDELYLDDTVDIIEEMPANVVKRILRSTDADTRSKINQILRYPEDSAGSIMTIEFVRLKKNMTVSEALTRIRRTGVDKETIYTCYVTEESNNKLIGLVTAKSLLLANEDDIISDIMETNIIFVNTHQDKEEVASFFDKYHFLALPVVDEEGRLVGIVTVDDAIEVITDEATEDIELMAAIIPGEKPYLKTSVFETWKSRIPWLMLLMLSSAFTGKIISSFESALSACVILTSYIPMLMGTGGNSGGQSSVTIIRALSLNDVQMGDILRILWKEIRVAFFCGITLGIANFAKMMIFDKGDIVSSVGDGAAILAGLPEIQIAMLVSLVVCIALVVTVFCAKVVGAALPVLVKRVGLDPAVMASPIVTTLVDAISLLVYFVIASKLLGI